MNTKLTFLFLFLFEASKAIVSAEAPQRFLPDNVRNCFSEVVTCGIPTAIQRCRESGTCGMYRTEMCNGRCVMYKCYRTDLCSCCCYSKKCFCKFAKIAGLVCLGTGAVGSACYFVSSAFVKNVNFSNGMRR